MCWGLVWGRPFVVPGIDLSWRAQPVLTDAPNWFLLEFRTAHRLVRGFPLESGAPWLNAFPIQFRSHKLRNAMRLPNATPAPSTVFLDSISGRPPRVPSAIDNPPKSAKDARDDFGLFSFWLSRAHPMASLFPPPHFPLRIHAHTNPCTHTCMHTYTYPCVRAYARTSACTRTVIIAVSGPA